MCGISGLAMVPPPTLKTVQLSITLPAFMASNIMPLAWKSSTTSGFHTIWVGAAFSSTEHIAASVR